MQTAEIDATYRVNGMGERCEEGSYIRTVVQTNTGFAEYKISTGQAEVLRDCLNGLLPEPGKPLYGNTVELRDARVTQPLDIIEIGGEDLFPGASIQDALDNPYGGLDEHGDFRDIPARPSALLEGYTNEEMVQHRDFDEVPSLHGVVRKHFKESK